VANILHYALSDGTPVNIRMNFIFLENKSPGPHFAADNIGLSSLKFFWWAPEFLFALARGRFGHSQASKVTDVGANRKRVCDFLLVPIVRNSNLGPILHRFGARTPFIVLLTSPQSNPNFGGVPVACTRSPLLGVNERMILSYSACNYFRRIPTYLNTEPDRYRRTDGRTDGQTKAIW